MLKFELGMILSDGATNHVEILRYNINEKLPEKCLQEIDIVKGTYQLFEISTQKMLTPLKLFIKYKKLHDEDKIHDNEIQKDLNVTWSDINPKPNTGQDGTTTEDPNPSVITIGDGGRHFEKDHIYLKL